MSRYGLDRRTVRQLAQALAEELQACSTVRPNSGYVDLGSVAAGGPPPARPSPASADRADRPGRQPWDDSLLERDEDGSASGAFLSSSTEVPDMASLRRSGDSAGMAFYRAALWALSEHAQRGGTLYGFGAVLKRLGREYGLEVEELPLPRPTRAEREARADVRRYGAL